MSKILVTGGAGYIGSHACVELINSGHDIVIVDNYCNSSPMIIDRIRQISNVDNQRIISYDFDLRDKASIEKIFNKYDIESVVHFASFKAVGESMEDPLLYYNNNLISTIYLLEIMRNKGVKNFIFSSSATVYGEPIIPAIKENFSMHPENTYGWTKYMIERMLLDLYNSDNDWNIALLRYFNPIGAHESGLIGENPKGIPNNLMPYILQVAAGKLDKLEIFGNDYDTRDGTGERDYIHVCDLARGHVSALDYFKNTNNNDPLIVNLGTGCGITVLEIIEAFEKATNIKIPYKFVGRRAGDIAKYYTDPSYAKEVMGWKTEYTVEDMCKHSWCWQEQNPNGC